MQVDYVTYKRQLREARKTDQLTSGSNVRVECLHMSPKAHTFFLLKRCFWKSHFSVEVGMVFSLWTQRGVSEKKNERDLTRSNVATRLRNRSWLRSAVERRRNATPQVKSPLCLWGGPTQKNSPTYVCERRTCSVAELTPRRAEEVDGQPREDRESSFASSVTMKWKWVLPRGSSLRSSPLSLSPRAR